MSGLRRLRIRTRRFFAWFRVYAEFRIKRLWFFLRYGGVKNVPPEALRRHFDREFKIISKGLAEADKKLPERIERVLQSGHEDGQELIQYLLRDSADLGESFNRTKQDVEFLLRAVAKKINK